MRGLQILKNSEGDEKHLADCGQPSSRCVDVLKWHARNLSDFVKLEILEEIERSVDTLDPLLEVGDVGVSALEQAFVIQTNKATLE